MPVALLVAARLAISGKTRRDRSNWNSHICLKWYCVLPDVVVKALDATPRSSDHYFFWTGKSTVRSSKGKWQRRLQRLFELAKVTGGHAHRFRDTFAVELLLAGVPLDRVSILLGHSSIRITERHYAPWTRSRQEQIENDLKAAWKTDPVATSHAGDLLSSRRRVSRPN